MRLPTHIGRRAWVVCWLLVWSALTANVASAHGDDRTLIMAATPAGPYTATVWVAPGVMRPGDMHVDVLLFKPDGRVLLTDQVEVEIMGMGESGVHYAAPAVATVQTGITREARFHIEQPGAYQVRITVEGVSGTGTLVFPMDVVRVPLLARGGIYLMVVLVGAVALLLLFHGITIMGRLRQLERVPQSM